MIHVMLYKVLTTSRNVCYLRARGPGRRPLTRAGVDGDDENDEDGDDDDDDDDDECPSAPLENVR